MGIEVSRALRQPAAQHGAAAPGARRTSSSASPTTRTASNRGILPIPLPDASFKGFWNKISLFRPDVFEPGRTLLYLDVDIVVVGAARFPARGRSADLTIIRALQREFRRQQLGHALSTPGRCRMSMSASPADAEAIVASGRYSWRPGLDSRAGSRRRLLSARPDRLLQAGHALARLPAWRRSSASTPGSGRRTG